MASPALWVDAMTQAIATFGLQIAGLGFKLYLQTADNALLHWQVPRQTGERTVQRGGPGSNRQRQTRPPCSMAR